MSDCLYITVRFAAEYGISRAKIQRGLDELAVSGRQRLDWLATLQSVKQLHQGDSMHIVTLRVETELDPSAAPRVFGYLGGLGHIPLQAALRRDANDALVLEVHFESPIPVAERISAKVEQMPFVLNSSIAWSDPSEASGLEEASAKPVDADTKGGMGHAPALPCLPRVDVVALQFAAAQRSRAIHHRSQFSRAN